MEKPPVKESLVTSYALGNAMNTFAFQVPTLFLSMFMTDYLGISPVAMANGMLIARFVDFAVAIVAGMIIEKVHMKHGKYLSWIRLVTATLFFGNIIQMLDTTAFVGNATGRLVIVMIFYMMFHCSMNFNATARAAILPKICGADMEMRKKFTARQTQLGALVSIFGSAIIVPLVNFMAKVTGQESLGYFIGAFIFSALFVIFNTWFVKQAAPYDPPETAAAARRTPSVGQMLESLVNNPQMLILFACFTIFTMGSQLYAGVITYFFKATGHFNDGSYNPASEEGGQSEQIGDTAQNAPAVTNAPMMQSEFAGATPVKIDPVDKPTPTPLPKITFSYTTYNAPNLHLTFEGPAGWIADDLAADTYILTNPDPSMDYEAKAEIRTIAAGKDYTQKELVKEAEAQAEALQGTGSFQSFSTSDTATRTFINGNGVYIAYKGTLNDGQETGVAGRIIVNTVNKVLYVLHVSYPRGLADTFADGVYNKIRHSMKLTN